MYCKLCNRIKNLCNNYKNLKVQINNYEKKKHDQIILLAKTKLNIREVLTSKALTNSNITHDEFVSVKDVLREYNYMKEPIKILGLLIKIM